MCDCSRHSGAFVFGLAFKADEEDPTTGYLGVKHKLHTATGWCDLLYVTLLELGDLPVPTGRIGPAMRETVIRKIREANEDPMLAVSFVWDD
jgi:hypothetical protein